MPKILVKALLHSILSQEFCLRFVFTLPAKPQLKPYVTLCKSCRLYSHLQVCFLVNLNFYLKFWSFGWSNGRWPNAFGALGAWARSRASRYRDAITTWRRSHRQHLGSRPQYCHGPARISLHRPVDRPELRGTLTPSRVARPHPCRRAPSLRSFPYLLATLLQAQDHALASGGDAGLHAQQRHHTLHWFTKAELLPWVTFTAAWALLHLPTASLKPIKPLITEHCRRECRSRSSCGRKSTAPSNHPVGAPSATSNPSNRTQGEPAPIPHPFPGQSCR